MLLQRIITALILASLCAVAVLKLPPEYFSLIIAIITLLAAWEWTDLIGIHSLSKRRLFLLALILPMLWLHFWTQFLELSAQLLELSVQHFASYAKQANLTTISSYLETADVPDIRAYSGILEWWAVVPVFFWILVMLLIRNAPAGVLKLELSVRHKALIGWIILLSAWMFLSRLRNFYGSEMTLYLLILIWLADISAYFAGKKFGKTKLAPEISPGKTVQGMYGALVVGTLWSVVFIGYYAYQDGFSWMRVSDFILLSVLTVLISIYGDLFLSVVKRQRGVKDTGSILPGHGGILDRIDSLLAAVPFFYAGRLLIELSV